MVRNTLAGSVKLLEASGLEPAELRRNVTSPGGTTERIIATLDTAQLDQVFAASLEAAVKRAQELAS
jgi:pyrroline-5-carboxylate reductase